MSKKGKIYIVLTALAILVIVVLEYTKPQKVNWFPSYVMHHKIPYGTYIFKEQLERIFPKENINSIDKSPFQFLKQNPDISGTYIFINNQLDFGEEELNELLNWTAKGNTLFVASEQLSQNLLDTLQIKKRVISNFNNLANKYQLQLVNKHLKPDSLYTFQKDFYMYYYHKIDTLKAKVVGVVDNFSEENKPLKRAKINVIKQDFGQGAIILSTFPQAFTNYFLLTNPNQNYTAGLISYINNSKPIYVDAHYKSGKKFFASPLYIMLNNQALKWAYYLLLIAVFMYVIFDGKRKQRAIPIVKPLRNQTLNFTRTIANMYYEKEKHKEIFNHKVNYFFEYIRNHFHLQTTNLDPTFVKQLAARSNNSLEDTKQLLETIQHFQTKMEIKPKELEQINSLIETFKAKNKWKKTKN